MFVRKRGNIYCTKNEVLFHLLLLVMGVFQQGTRYNTMNHLHFCFCYWQTRGNTEKNIRFYFIIKKNNSNREIIPHLRIVILFFHISDFPF